jgi:hypothetical protein
MIALAMALEDPPGLFKLLSDSFAKPSRSDLLHAPAR